MEQNKFERAVSIGFAAYAAFCVAITVAMAFVIVHFIRKYW